MGMDNISDRVNINLPGGSDGGMGGLGAAAVIAAMGNRNEGSDNAALIAALGNRNDGMGANALLPALMAGGGGLGGQNALWPIILLALLGRGGRGGLFGGGGDECCDGGAETRLQSNADTLAILNGINGAKDATTDGFATTGLALSQGFANVKDAVQSLALFQTGQLNTINQNVSEQGCKTRELVQAGTTQVLQRMDDLRIRELEARAERAERAIEVNSLRSQVEITNTNTATATQAQGQQQTQLQFQDINHRIGRLCDAIAVVGNQIQRVKSDQDIVNFGTMAASGNQATTSTQVR